MSEAAAEVSNHKSIRRFIKNKIKTEGFKEFSIADRDVIAKACEKDPQGASALIAAGFLAWSDKNFDEASKFFNEALTFSISDLSALRGFEIGVTSWLRNPRPIEEQERSPVFFPGPDKLNFLKRAGDSLRALTILTSCDDSYFQQYGLNFISYVRNKFKNFNVHVHVINPSELTKTTLRALELTNISVTVEDETENSFRAFYASRRFLIAPALMEFFSTDLLITDIDVFPSCNFEFITDRLLDERFDIACGKVAKPWMPWNTYIVSQLLVRNSFGGRKALELAAAYMQRAVERLGSFKNAWWIDQNAMYHAIETGRLKGAVSFQAINAFGSLFLGPSAVGKSQFAALCEDFSESSNEGVRSPLSIGVFFKRNHSALSEDVAFLRNCLVSFPEGHSQDALELLISLHRAKRLSNRLNDHLIACLLKKKDYSGSLEFIREFCGIKNVGPRWTSIEGLASDRSRETLFIEKILPFLLRSGMDYSISELQDHYTGARKEITEAFFLAHIRILIRRGNIKGAKTAISERFPQTLMVVGLQRSGTNYVAELLRLNTKAYIPLSDDSSIFWKHCLANENNAARVNPIFKDPVDALIRMNARGVVVVKSPISWVESVTKRNPADFFRTRRKYIRDSEKIGDLARFYRHFLETWYAAGEHAIFVKYEAVLADPGMLFTQVPGLSRDTGSLVIPASVPYSQGGFDESRRELYLEGKTSLRSDEVALIRELVPDTFMNSIFS